MVGFALSGVALALAARRRARHGALLLRGAAGAADRWRRRSAFISPRTTRSTRCNCRIRHLGAAVLEHRGLLRGAAAVLLPGRAVHQPELRAERRRHRPSSMACDLTGAGVGAALVLALMFVVHPFRLVPALLVPLAVGALLAARGAGAGHGGARRRWRCSRPRRCCCSAASRELTISRRSTRRCIRRTRGRGRAVVAARRLRRCSMISPSGWTPTSPTMPACSACPGRRAASGCIATATGSRRCPCRAPGPFGCSGYARRRRWMRCRMR